MDEKPDRPIHNTMRLNVQKRNRRFELAQNDHVATSAAVISVYLLRQ